MTEKYAVVYEHTEHHSDDGYGQSYTARFEVYKEFDSLQKFEDWVRSAVNPGAYKSPTKFRAFKVTPLTVTTAVQVSVKVD